MCRHAADQLLNNSDITPLGHIVGRDTVHVWDFDTVKLRWVPAPSASTCNKSNNCLDRPWIAQNGRTAALSNVMDIAETCVAVM
jgi:hypothetical protein